MRHLDFVLCPADPDVWMRPAKRSDGSEYYEYILLYTDYALVVSENTVQVLQTKLGRYWTLKEESIGLAKIYLGGTDHAADTVTRRSRTGFFVYLNCAPVYLLSKKQTSCESSSFGSEFMAMNQCCEYL